LVASQDLTTWEATHPHAARPVPPTCAAHRDRRDLLRLRTATESAAVGISAALAITLGAGGWNSGC